MVKQKTIKRIVLMVLVLAMAFALASCTTKLKGTYTTTEGLIKQSFTFMDDGVVKVSAFGIDVEGKYVIEDGKITITYSLLNISYDWEKSFSKDGDSIFIDGTEFVKES